LLHLQFIERDQKHEDPSPVMLASGNSCFPEVTRHSPAEGELESVRSPDTHQQRELESVRSPDTHQQRELESVRSPDSPAEEAREQNVIWRIA